MKLSAWIMMMALPAAMAAELNSVQADKDNVLFKLKQASDYVTLNGYTVNGEKITSVKLPVANGVARLPRQQTAYDPTLLGWRLASSSKLAPRFVTDFLWVPQTHRGTLKRPKEIKGISCVVDMDDAVALGARYIHTNVNINAMKAAPGDPNAIPYAFDGETVYFNGNTVNGLDHQFSEFYKRGIAVFVVYTNVYTEDPVLKHPGSRKEPPMMLCAFNTKTREGIRFFAATCAFFAERYARPDAKYGQICGLIIGNEFQQHAIWYNLGYTDLENVAIDYGNAIRLAWLGVARTSPDLRIYVSMEHHWMLGDVKNQKVLPGRPVLEAVHKHLRDGGDIPWNIAFHPYPENLFNPCFWNDRSAKNSFDTPRITFKNIDILPKFFRQKAWRYRGAVRDIALTEQGFNLPDETEEGETIQAAAYAYAYTKIKKIPEISAFILHRHADHAQEGGLKLGVRATKPGSVWQAGKKRRAWNVFKAAGTSHEAEAFAFALPVIGIKTWDDEPKRKELNLPKDSRKIFDCLDAFDSAKLDNNLDISIRDYTYAAGWLVSGIYQHPNLKGWGSVSFHLKLPKLKPNQTLAFTSIVLVDHKDSNGVAYRVAVNDKILKDAIQKPGKPTELSIDLSEFAGHEITLSLQDNANGNMTGDWFYWLSPMVILNER